MEPLLTTAPTQELPAVNVPADPEPIPIGTTTQQSSDEIPLAPTSPRTPIPDTGVARERAKKIQEGVGEHLERSTDQIYQDIVNGREQTLRETAASNEASARYAQKLNNLRNLASQSPQPLNEDEVNKVMDPFNAGPISPA